MMNIGESIRKVIDEEWHREAMEAGQMTLGAFIDALEKMRPDKQIRYDFAHQHPTEFNSYRGSYSDLALGFRDDGPAVSVAEILADAREAMGRTFTGYKGGDYVMHEGTILWASNYGHGSGSRIIALQEREYDVVIRTVMDEE